MIKVSLLENLLSIIQERYISLNFFFKRHPIILNQNEVDKSIKDFLSSYFLQVVGYEPSIDNPITFNEKLQWYKLYYRDPLITLCSDKYRVRDYIKEKIGEKYLINLLGAYNDIAGINFGNLPNKFVLKVNHGAAQNIISTDKKSLNISETLSKLNEWMKPTSNHYYSSYEWGYKNIKPKIICEEYLGKVSDYKIYCFNGDAKLILYATDRQKNLKIDFLNLNWKKLSIRRGPKNIDRKYSKPNLLGKIIELANILSKPFPFVRVDFFIVRSKIYIGEMTFYPGAGLIPFEPIEWDYKLGDMLKLPIHTSAPNNTVQYLKQLLIAAELRYGGKISNVPRKKVSPLDPRTPEQLKSGGMIGGDRMLHHNYSGKYSFYLLEKYKNKQKITLIEIGVLTGIGLAIWCNLFRSSRIIGLDIDLSHFYNNIGNLFKLGAFSDNFPEIYEFDQYIDNKLFVEKLLKGNKIDVCIDDGCHSNKCIMTTFQSMLPNLSNNFTYFIEDNAEVHTLIREKYPELDVVNDGELTIVTNKKDLKY